MNTPLRTLLVVWVPMWESDFRNQIAVVSICMISGLAFFVFAYWRSRHERRWSRIMTLILSLILSSIVWLASALPLWAIWEGPDPGTINPPQPPARWYRGVK